MTCRIPNPLDPSPKDTSVGWRDGWLQSRVAKLFRIHALLAMLGWIFALLAAFSFVLPRVAALSTSGAWTVNKTASSGRYARAETFAIEPQHAVATESPTAGRLATGGTFRNGALAVGARHGDRPAAVCEATREAIALLLLL